MSVAPPSSSPIPSPREDDVDDVAWALQTAQVQWQRGGRAEALTWLKRASEAALEAEVWLRAQEINVAAAEFERDHLEPSTATELARRQLPTGPRHAPDGVSAPPPPGPPPRRPGAGIPAPPSRPLSTRLPSLPISRRPTLSPPVSRETYGDDDAEALPRFPSSNPPPHLRTRSPVLTPTLGAPGTPFGVSLQQGNISLDDVADIEDVEDVEDLGGAEIDEEDSDAYSRASAPEIDVRPFADDAIDAQLLRELADLPEERELPSSRRALTSRPPSTSRPPLPSRSRPPPTSRPPLPRPPTSRPPPPSRPSLPPDDFLEPLEDGSRLDSAMPGFDEDTDEPTAPTSRSPGTSPVTDSGPRSGSSRPAASGARNSVRLPSAPSAGEVRKPRVIRPPSMGPADGQGSRRRYSTRPPPPGAQARSVGEENSLVPREPSLAPSSQRGSGRVPFAPRESAAASVPPIPESSGRRQRYSSSRPGVVLDELSVPSLLPRSEPEPLTSSLLPPQAAEPSHAVDAPESAAPPAESAIPSGPPSVEGVLLAEVRGLQDLPEDAQRQLVASARIEALECDEELSFFAVALVTRGGVRIMPAISDASCAYASVGEVVFTSGSLPDGVELRVSAGEDKTRVAVWDRAELEVATSGCSWVADDLRLIADSFQALAGVAVGALGERLDDSLRALVTERCEVRTLTPNEVIVEQGKPMTGMHIVGGGRVELVHTEGGTESVQSTLGPGDFLFGPEILTASPAPRTARAGKGGALVLFADRRTAHELLVSVPPLLEIFAG